MKQLTQQEKLTAVKANPLLMDEYERRLINENLRYSRNNCKHNGKRVGIHKFTNIQKAIAANVYDDFNNKTPVKP